MIELPLSYRRLVLGATTACLLWLAQPMALGQAVVIVPACKAERLQHWQPWVVKWKGACQAGVAEGLGVLLAYDKGRLAEAFYGRVRKGQPEFGVVETADGYLAGRFMDGKLITNDDRNTLIRAFREGASAALVASESFKRKGNQVSAKYYKDAAERLQSQMD